MKPRYAKQVVAGVFAASLLSTGLLVLGRDPPKPQPMQERKVDDADLRAFAKAYVRYHKIRKTYEPRLNATRDPAAGKRLRDEANSKFKAALASQQLTPQSYNRVFTLVSHDETLRQKAAGLIEEERALG